MLTLQTPQLLESYIGHAHGLHPSKSTPMDALEVVGNTKELGLDLPKVQSLCMDLGELTVEMVGEQSWLVEEAARFVRG